MSDLVGENLACRRGERLVFAGLGCAVPAGGALLLTGANGSGKSSLLRLLATLLMPEAGRLLWEGAPVSADLARYRARLHYVGHLDAIKPALTVRETLAFWAALRGVARPALDAALAAFALGPLADWPCRWLSAGQRRRLALARLIAAPAAVWLLDEPTAALDGDGERRLTAAIEAHRQTGGRVVVATHQPLALAGAARLALENFAAAADEFVGGVLTMARFLALFRRELSLSVRQGGEIGLALGFFVLAVVLFPLGVGPEAEILGRIGAGIIWVAALLAAVLSLDRLFAGDHADGGLDLLALSGLPLEAVAAAKCAAHWVTTGLPLTVLSPFLAELFDLDRAAIPILAISLLIGTPALSLLGGIVAALTIGARRPGVLSSLLVLPLYLPVLIFGSGAVEAGMVGGGARPHLLLLGALSLAAMPLAPLATAAALRQALD